MGDAERPRSSGRGLLALAIAATLLAPCVFVLGIGPAARLCRDFPATRAFIEPAYLPLDRLVLTHLPMRTYYWYMGVWGVPIQYGAP